MRKSNPDVITPFQQPPAATGEIHQYMGKKYVHCPSQGSFSHVYETASWACFSDVMGKYFVNSFLYKLKKHAGNWDKKDFMVTV